ncbi:MAG: dienelactone hydrolase family protein [Gammaproteobacteria bacterium]|nr:MAG: dienelactone hydrolase family protein [Gammaproteobacteria bacterium]
MSRQNKRTLKTVLGLICVVFCAAACEPQQMTEDPDKAAALENVDAMSREHAGDTATPSEAASIAAERAVVAETLAYAEVADELRYGHFVIPSDMVDPLPAIIVIHEWWGLNDGVRSVADRLAGLGYIVLAVDLYGGKIAATPADARKMMLDVVENPEDARENIRQAYQFLEETAGAPSIGSLGWCFGGGWSLNTALLFPDELDATVIYYGQVTDDEAKLEPMNVPILGIFGAKDKGIPVASVRRFEHALKNLSKDYEIEVYPGVGHAFANPSGNNYNAEAADKAWQRTVAFLNRHLTIPDEK